MECRIQLNVALLMGFVTVNHSEYHVTVFDTPIEHIVGGRTAI